MLNIYSSQTVHPLYFKQIENEGEHAVEYLTAIQTLPQFNTQYLWYNSRSGQDIHDTVYRTAIIRNARIMHLQQVLAVNPNARDVLVELSSLYRLQGDQNHAESFLNQAKKIDPGLQ